MDTINVRLLAPTPVIEKQLGAAEDLLLGDGTVTQVRNGVPIQVTRFGAASIPYSGTPEDGNVVSIREKLENTLQELDDSILSAVGPVLSAFAQANALLGIGIGTSYVNGDGHLIMGYNEATVSDLHIDSNGRLILSY